MNVVLFSPGVFGLYRFRISFVSIRLTLTWAQKGRWRGRKWDNWITVLALRNEVATDEIMNNRTKLSD